MFTSPSANNCFCVIFRGGYQGLCSRSFDNKLKCTSFLNQFLQIEFGIKTNLIETQRKISYCHHRPKMSSFSLRILNIGQSIRPTGDLANHCVHDSLICLLAGVAKVESSSEMLSSLSGVVNIAS